MPHDSRASGNCPERSFEELERSGVACAAGQAQVTSNRGHAGDIRLKKPMSGEDRDALANLCQLGVMVRRGDRKGYGTATQVLATNDIAARLKARGFAVSSFDQQTMYPSNKGKRLYVEMSNASSD